MALATGATDGIGETIAEELFREGAAVVLAAPDPAKLQAFAQRLDPTGQRVHPQPTDVSRYSDAEAMVAAAQQRFGALHLAVNNAAVFSPPSPLHQVDLAEWEIVLSVGLAGVFHCMKAEIPAMLQNGGDAIVNMSSANGIVGLAGLSPYTAVKHGVLGLTRSAALDYAADSIRGNAVGPGYVDTPRMRQSSPDMLAQFAKAHPLGRMATRQEVAHLVLFLLSARSSFCTGGFFPVEGGYTAQ